MTREELIREAQWVLDRKLGSASPVQGPLPQCVQLLVYGERPLSTEDAYRYVGFINSVSRNILTILKDDV